MSTDKQQNNINTLFDTRYKEYEDIRLKSTDEDDKKFKMELFYINYLKEFFNCLKKNAGITLIGVERFSRNDGTRGHMYVPFYVNTEGEKKMSTHGYPYKATALIKILFGFTSYVEEERLEN